MVLSSIKHIKFWLKDIFLTVSYYFIFINIVIQGSYPVLEIKSLAFTPYPVYIKAGEFLNFELSFNLLVSL